MPKVILEYNLPEELEEYELAMNGKAFERFTTEFELLLRKMYKYDEHPSEQRSLTAEECKLVETIKELYFETKSEFIN